MSLYDRIRRWRRGPEPAAPGAIVEVQLDATDKMVVVWCAERRRDAQETRYRLIASWGGLVAYCYRRWGPWAEFRWARGALFARLGFCYFGLSAAVPRRLADYLERKGYVRPRPKVLAEGRRGRVSYSVTTW